MRIKSIMSGAVIVTVVIIMATVILSTAFVQSACASSVGTNSDIKPMSDKEFKALSAQEDAKVNKMISDSVQEQYEKMKANGTIPVLGSTSKYSLIQNASLVQSAPLLQANSMWTMTGSNNDGLSGSSSWGVFTPIVGDPQMHQWTQPYSNAAGAYTFCNNYGYGGAESWAWIGYTFTFPSSGYNGQSVQWSVPISWLGSFVEAGASSGHADISYCVRDNTDKIDYPSTTPKSWDANMISLSGITGSGNYAGNTINLYAGHSYTFYVKLYVKSQIAGYSLGSMSDWCPSGGGLHTTGSYSIWGYN